MATAWIAYSWDDKGDVEYIINELDDAGLTVRRDETTLTAGYSIWRQIDAIIASNEECDAFILYMTQSSLKSEKCREELDYALNRALIGKGTSFPVIGLSPGGTPQHMIPGAIKSRLYVSTTDPNWKERIIAAAEGRGLNIPRPTALPYEIRLHPMPAGFAGTWTQAVEIRPRAETWAPFVCAVPAGENDKVKAHVTFGYSGGVPGGVSGHQRDMGVSDDGQWAWTKFSDTISPTTSIYVFCEALPTKICFGRYNGVPQYIHEFE